MAVCRVIKDRNYTVVNNYHIDDKRLTYKARGLLTTMLRLPDDWNYTIEGLTTLANAGMASVRSAIEELEKFHYIRRQRLRGEGGKFGDNEYLIYERPYDEPLCENQTMDEAPSCEKRTYENRTQLNTKIPSTKEPIPPKAPQGGRRVPKKAPDHEPEMFDRFWKAYPRKEDKQGAIAEWDKVRTVTRWSLFGTEVSNSDTYRNLSFSKALALLALPEGERETFVAAHDVEEMSTRELREAIRERDDAIQARDTALEDVKKAEEAECYEIMQKAQEYAANLPCPGWATEKFQQAIADGITDGTRPAALVTRCEAAIMADRARGVAL